MGRIYRNSNVIIAGAKHTSPDALEVPQKMRDLVDWVKENKSKLHIIELSSLLHHKIVHIHPFFDGNGRVARIMMNLLLMQSGFPLVIILKNDHKKYYNILEQADKENYKPLVRFIAQAIERSLDLYFKVLTPMTQKRERYLTLAELAKQVPYSAKYLNLLVRQGKLEAHKEGRNWFISKEAINRYIKSRERKRKVKK